MKKIWTEAEDTYIKIYYPKEKNADLADELGVGKATLSKRAKELGVKKFNYAEIREKNGILVKTCRKCWEELPLERFGKNSYKDKGGYQSWCKACQNDHAQIKNRKVKKEGN